MATRSQWGQQIREARMGQGLSQRATAEKAGVPSWAVAQAEVGNTVGEDKLKKISTLFSIPVPEQFDKDTNAKKATRSRSKTVVRSAPAPQQENGKIQPREFWTMVEKINHMDPEQRRILRYRLEA